MPPLLGLALLAALALSLTRLPLPLAVGLWLLAVGASALPLRRLWRLREIEVAAPDLLALRAVDDEADEWLGLQGWHRLGPLLLLRASERALPVPLWLPALPDETRRVLLRTLAVCRPSRHDSV